MATVIKATDRTRGVQGVAFNFDDLATKGKQYLDDLRAQGAKLVLRAQDEARSIRQKAEIEGRRAAQLTQSQELDEKVAKQMQTVIPALRSAVGQLQHARQAWLSQWEGNVIHLATAIAARVIRRELKSDPRIATALVREALELAGECPVVRLLLNPEDHAALGPQTTKLTAEFARLGSAQIVADASVSPGGCVVETAFGQIDQRVESQLGRIEAELNG